MDLQAYFFYQGQGWCQKIAQVTGVVQKHITQQCMHAWQELEMDVRLFLHSKEITTAVHLLLLQHNTWNYNSYVAISLHLSQQLKYFGNIARFISQEFNE